MLDVALSVTGVFCGCQANVFFLELITFRNTNILYALTFAQYVVVSLLLLPVVCTFSGFSPPRCWVPVRLRPARLSTLHKVVLAVFSWAMTVGSNLALGFYISVPFHATFRSSSLLLNMLAGYFFLKKRYTLLQVLCAVAITCGVITLAMEKSRNVQSVDILKKDEANEEYFWWLCGLFLLACTTVLSTWLGVFQEYMYKSALPETKEVRPKDVADASSPSPPPLWAEALFFSHAISIPLFFLRPQLLFHEIASISPSNYVYVGLNALTQFFCITSVYVLNAKTSAFTLILTLTLRKLGTFLLSVFYFGHYHRFSVIEWLAMVIALLAAAVYPLLPKAHLVSDVPMDISAGGKTD